MEFLKHKGGIIVAVICLAVLAFVVGFCLMNNRRNTTPEGTLVEWSHDRIEVLA